MVISSLNYVNYPWKFHQIVAILGHSADITENFWRWVGKTWTPAPSECWIQNILQSVQVILISGNLDDIGVKTHTIWENYLLFNSSVLTSITLLIHVPIKSVFRVWRQNWTDSNNSPSYRARCLLRQGEKKNKFPAYLNLEARERYRVFM